MTTPPTGDAWLPPAFQPPQRVELPTGHHLRPIRGSDVGIDYPAVMGSQASLWERYGQAWGWPPPDMTVAQDQADLERHEREMVARQSFNYAVLDAGETQLLGCVYIDPPEDDVISVAPDPVVPDAIVSWWVVDAERGGQLDRCLAEFVPRWLADAWPIDRPRFAP